LLKALYSLKHAPKLWHDEINGFLLSLGFQRADADPNLYLRGDVFIILYVDDILVFYHPDNSHAASSVKAMLMRQYRMKDLGPVRQFLGLEISRNGQHTITLGQQAYIDTILQRFEMTTAYGVQTPLDPNVRLDGHGQQGGVEVDPTQYQAIVGSLMYAALGTRPDITYAVAALSRYNSRPLTVHLTAAKRVLRYLKTTRTAKLHYSTDGVTELHGYTDADGAGDSADRKSQGGYTFIMGGAAVSWQSRKQPLSTLEAEYIVCSDAVRETKWLLQLAKDVDFHTTAEKTTAAERTTAETTTAAERTTAERTTAERTTAERTIAKSKTDAEKWLQQLAKDVNIRQTAAEKTTADEAERTTAAMESVTLYCDNQDAIKTIVTGTSKASTKHIDVRFHNSRHAILGTHMPPVLSTAPTSLQTRTRRIYAQRHWRHLATDIWWTS
jgi:phage terminase small subunit